MKNFTKINQEVFEHEFLTFWGAFKISKPIAQRIHFLADLPLGFFLEHEKVKSMQQIVYNEFQHINNEAGLAYISYK